MEACGIHETTYNSISATLISVRTSTPTLSCPVAPPCTPVLPTECRRRSPPLLPPPSRSRSSLPPRESTPYGSVAPSSPPSPPSSRCGSLSRSTTSAVPPSSTASASKRCADDIEISVCSVTIILYLRFSSELQSLNQTFRKVSGFLFLC